MLPQYSPRYHSSGEDFLFPKSGLINWAGFRAPGAGHHGGGQRGVAAEGKVSVPQGRAAPALHDERRGEVDPSATWPQLRRVGRQEKMTGEHDNGKDALDGRAAER